MMKVAVDEEVVYAPALKLYRAITGAALKTARLGRLVSNAHETEPDETELLDCHQTVKVWVALIDAWQEATEWNRAGNKYLDAYDVQSIEDACRMDTRGPLAAEGQRLFRGLVTGEANEESTAMELARVRHRLGERADLVDVFFRMLIETWRIASTNGQPNQSIDAALAGFIQGDRFSDVPTREERALYRRAEGLFTACDADRCREWLRTAYSEESRLLRDRAGLDAYGIADRHELLKVTHPDIHDWRGISSATKDFILAGVPYSRERQFRLEWSKRMVWLCIATSSADISWTQLGLVDVDERTWIWQILIMREDARAAFNELVLTACEELERERNSPPIPSTEAPRAESLTPSVLMDLGLDPLVEAEDEPPNADPWSEEGQSLVLQDSQGITGRVPVGTLAWAGLLVLKQVNALDPLPLSEFFDRVTKALFSVTAAYASSDLDSGLNDGPHDPEWAPGQVRRNRRGPEPRVYSADDPLGNLDKFNSSLRKHMYRFGNRGPEWRLRWIHADRKTQTIWFGPE